MAGDWIKMRCDLHTHPKVVRMASALKADKLRIVGGLHAVWSLFDAHSEDGKLDGYDASVMDCLIGFDGFSGAMIAVGWMTEEAGTLVVPRFDEHNGKSAKRRAQDVVRKRLARSPESVQDLSACEADEMRTREEKRREEVKDPLNPPEGEEKKASKRVRKERTSLTTFLQACKDSGKKPVSSYKPLMEYVEKVALPADFLALAWDVFRKEHSGDGPNSRRLQADWQKHFYNYVTKGYYRLWVCKADGKFELTSLGIQNRKFMEAA